MNTISWPTAMRLNLHRRHNVTADGARHPAIGGHPRGEEEKEC